MIKVPDLTGTQVEYSYDCLMSRVLEKFKTSEKKNKITRFTCDSIGRLERVTTEEDKNLIGLLTKNKVEI